MFHLAVKTQDGFTPILPKTGALYILSHQGEVRYIGCTSNLRKRIYQQGKKEFTCIHWLFLYAPELESKLIAKWRPPLNKRGAGLPDRRPTIPHIWQFLEAIKPDIEYCVERKKDELVGLMDAVDPIYCLQEIIGMYGAIRDMEQVSRWQQLLQECEALRLYCANL